MSKQAVLIKDIESILQVDVLKALYLLHFTFNNNVLMEQVLKAILQVEVSKHDL